MRRHGALLVCLLTISCASGDDAPAVRAEPVKAAAGAPAPSISGSDQEPAAPKSRPRPAAEPETVRCVPKCLDRICGPDPVCGEPCGACKAGLRCTEGECVAADPPRENGQTCSSGAQCASGLCAPNLSGEMHCYGKRGINQSCSDTFDCAGGACIPTTPSGASVCTDGPKTCTDLNLSGDCAVAVLLFCQIRKRDCPALVADFDACFVDNCADLVRSNAASRCTAAVDALSSGQLDPCQ